jgi:hypothetical protein
VIGVIFMGIAVTLYIFLCYIHSQLQSRARLSHLR